MLAEIPAWHTGGILTVQQQNITIPSKRGVPPNLVSSGTARQVPGSMQCFSVEPCCKCQGQIRLICLIVKIACWCCRDCSIWGWSHFACVRVPASIISKSWNLPAEVAARTCQVRLPGAPSQQHFVQESSLNHRVTERHEFGARAPIMVSCCPPTTN